MADINHEEVIACFTAEFGDGWKWDGEGEEFVREGESADDEPSWAIGVFTYWDIKYELGWYVQRGEAQSLDECVRVMKAMLVAAKALNDSLREQEER